MKKRSKFVSSPYIVNLTRSSGLIFMGLIKENDNLSSLLEKSLNGDIKMYKYEQHIHRR